MGEILIQAKGLTKQFFRQGRNSAQHFDAVSNASLDLCAGKFVVLKGRSGGGKSTLLNMLAGLLVPTSGHVLLGDTDMYALDDGQLSRLRNERIGVVPQGQTPLHSLSVVQNVTFPYLMYRADAHIESRAMELLERLGIRALADSYPCELSGGEMRRMAIARALICQPDVLLADEPTSDLDDENTQIALKLMREAADNGASVLVATHDQEAFAFADCVLRIDAGVLTRESA